MQIIQGHFRPYIEQYLYYPSPPHGGSTLIQWLGFLDCFSVLRYDPDDEVYITVFPQLPVIIKFTENFNVTQYYELIMSLKSVFSRYF